MNFAFPAFLVVLYALPGVALANGMRDSFRRFNGSSQTPDWASQIGYGAALALPVHCLWIALAKWLKIEPRPDIFSALSLLTDKSGSDARKVLETIGSCKVLITLYFSTAIGVTYALGRLTGIFLSALSFQLLGTSPWDSVLYNSKSQRKAITAVVERGPLCYLYRGLYLRKVIDEKGSLKGIWLSGPKRRILTEDRPDDPSSEAFYPIEAHELYLATDKIQSLSVTTLDIVPSDMLKNTQDIAYKLYEERRSANRDGSADDDWARALRIQALHYRWSIGIRTLIPEKIRSERIKSAEEEIKRAS